MVSGLYQQAQESQKIKQHAETLNTQLEKNKEAYRKTELELETKLKNLKHPDLSKNNPRIKHIRELL